ncbi:MAG: hypothetical protein KDB40_06260 [Acidimicrobiales bacterium]|nr:hypothetical protein [Acidimicrobiales bacterium]
MPQRHHRHHDQGADVDDEFGRFTLVDPESGMLAHDVPEAIGADVDADDDELSPEEAALHVEPLDLDR